jgi:hypothetical protein
MWKVLVAICLYTQPCVVFHETPMVYYETEQECQVMAEEKGQGMVNTLHDMGYYVESAAWGCKQVENSTET